jgi:hypothetical protein
MERKRFSNSEYRGIAWFTTFIIWIISIFGYFLISPDFCWYCIILIALIWNLEMGYDIYYWIKSKPTKLEWRNGIIYATLFIFTMILVLLLINKYL